MSQKIRDEMKRYFYYKDYDSKLGINADMLADEMYSWMKSYFPDESKSVEPKKETVTIKGITYTLEEIKK